MRWLLGALAVAGVFASCSALAGTEGQPTPIPFDPKSSPVLKAAGPVTPNPAGRAGRDEVIVSLPVRHGLTGVLKSEIATYGLLDKTVYPAGAAVFGIPMGFAKGPEIVWCMPQEASSTICFPPRYEGYAVSYGGGFFPTMIEVRDTAHSATKPVVDYRAPVDLPILTLVVAFREWDKTDADVRVTVRSPTGVSSLGDQSLPREADGSALLSFNGGLYRLSQEGKDRRTARVEVVKPADAPR